MLKEGDIEAIRRGMKDQGRSVKSNTIVDKDGTRVHYSTDDKGRVTILGKND